MKASLGLGVFVLWYIFPCVANMDCLQALVGWTHLCMLQMTGIALGCMW